MYLTKEEQILQDKYQTLIDKISNICNEDISNYIN
jgi:hypothetical protein